MSKTSTMMLFAMAGTFVACTENAVSPGSATADNSSYAHVGGATQSLTPSDTLRFAIVIDPKVNSKWNLGGGNMVTFPANSLCDLSSTYGPTQWDKPCTVAKSPVTLQVTEWIDSNGHPRVDFVPSVRFVSDPKLWVVVTFSDWVAAQDPWYNILYCKTATSSCYDESLTDPSLATFRDPKTGKVSRRLKHFSGYNVAAGGESMMNRIPNRPSALHPGSESFSISNGDFKLDDLESVTAAYPTLNASQANIMLKRIRTARDFSGYILASGLAPESH